MPAKLAVIYYSTYGHITKLTESIVEGAKSTGAQVDVFQIPETLSAEVLAKQHAIPRPDVPTITGDKLEEYDGFIFGFPTRYGRAPAQVSAFFDSTGKQWASGKLVGKLATVYTSTASQHGGLETTALTTIPFFAHQGIAYVPTGFAAPELTGLDEIVGGSAYGAGTVAGGDGSRQPTAGDLSVAKHQGTYFSNFANTFVAGKAKLAGQASDVAAEALPASATGAPATSQGATQEGYAVEKQQKEQPSTATETNAQSASTATAPVATANPGTSTQQPTSEKKPEAKKASIWARCCGSSKDYAN